jgi:hypothetical protein
MHRISDMETKINAGQEELRQEIAIHTTIFIIIEI